jgi:hypothetical protein
MEMWLRTSGKEMLFPIMPSSFNLEGSSTIHTSNVVKLGEVSVYGGNNLRSISIESFFPSKKYHFVKVDVPKMKVRKQSAKKMKRYEKILRKKYLGESLHSR